MKKIFLIIIISAFLSSPFAQTRDIINPLRLKSGKTDSILASDLFYSESYDLKFSVNENMNISYNPASLMLTITPYGNTEGMDLIEAVNNNEKFFIPVITEKIFEAEFSFQPEKDVKNVNLFGSFNGWNRQSLPMSDENNDGIYEVTVQLEPGLYEYKFFVDGEELVDPNNPLQKPNGFGGFNSLYEVKSKHTDKSYLHIMEKEAIHTGYRLSFFYEKENQKFKLTRENIIALHNNKKIPDNLIKINDNDIILLLEGKEYLFPEDDIEIRIAVTHSGQVTNIQSVKINSGENIKVKDHYSLNDMIIYSIMIDRFYDGDKRNSKPVQHPELSSKANYQGGDLQGIIEKIEEGYFENLGINTLWISPVNDNTNSAYQEYPPPHRFYSGYHGYWPVSSTLIDEHFGDMNLLKKLIKKAHEKGIKVLLDFVSNHVHIEHPYWVEHRDWFGVLDLPDGRKNLRMWDEYRLTTWFEPYLPSFDYIGSKEALETMTDNAVWWLKETGADGFRHDAVKHVPNEFWRLLTKKIKEYSGDSLIFYQIGETFGSYDLVSSYVNNGQLDAQFNFNLYDMALPVFLNEGNSFRMLDNEMKKTFAVYGVDHVMGNVMDSHDKTRYMAYADGDISLSEWSNAEIGWKNPPQVNNESSYNKLKLHLAYILSIPGIPVIYYGDEIGMTGAPDPDNRRMMKFGEQLSNWERGTLRDVSEIIGLRKKSSALKYGDFLTLIADENIYAYVRSDGEERIITILNKNENEQQIKINLPEIYNINNAVNLVNGEIIKLADNNLPVTVPGTGYLFFKLEK